MSSSSPRKAADLKSSFSCPRSFPHFCFFLGSYVSSTEKSSTKCRDMYHPAQKSSFFPRRGFSCAEVRKSFRKLSHFPRPLSNNFIISLLLINEWPSPHLLYYNWNTK